MEEIPVKELIHTLTETLKCSQRRLASLLGMDKNTLSNNIDRSLADLTPKTGKKLASLYALVTDSLMGYDRDAIIEILQYHIFKNYTGEVDSVISAIQMDKYPLDMLQNILKSSIKDYNYRRQQKLKIKLQHVRETISA